MAYGGGFVGEVDDTYGVGNSTFTNCYVAKCTVISETDDSQGTRFFGRFCWRDDRFNIDPSKLLCVSNSAFYRRKCCAPRELVFLLETCGADSTIVDTNCYFGACGTTDRAGTATEKQDEEFENGTVAGSLGEAFAQARDYPGFKDSPADYSAVEQP